jgi:branched-chain amino acid transport system ATP-binding protein
MASMLEIRDLDVTYGVIQALKGINLEVQKGEIVALVGANGAGKSTVLKALTGLIPSRGFIGFENKEITSVPAHRRVAMGIALVPEGRGIFANMTVLENLFLGAYRNLRDRAGTKAQLEEVFQEFPRLRERGKQLGGTLSGGEQQMLAIGRALMSRPRLMLLDEPSMGLAPTIVVRIFKIIKRIRELGTTVLLVEQNANAALKTADRAYVLETGTIVKSGPALQLRRDPEVKAAYLG